MNTVLATPGRMALPAIPSIGMIITPFFPFSVTPTLWFGMPAPIVWVLAMILLLVIALRLVENSYLRAGGAEQDRLEVEAANTDPSRKAGH